MSVNNLTINQAATILNEIQSQANIGGTVDVVDGASFVSAATTTLKAGYDVVLNAISQVLSRTIFAVRPYKGKLDGLTMGSEQFGNITRKLSIADTEFENGEFDLPVDGQAVDHYKIKRANVLQANFYGANNFELQSPTIFKNQLDIAFSSPDELVRFWGMITQNAYDMIEQAHENLRRATLANYIGGKIAGTTAGVESGNVIHLLAEYNTATGLQLDAQTVRKPENFPAFMKWVYARIKAVSKLMEERSQRFHTNVTGKAVSRHTPKEFQKLYLLAPEVYQFDATVLSDTFNKELVTFADYEEVSFWQNIDSPDSINVAPVYLKSDGTLEEVADSSAIAASKIFGVLFDKDTLGVSYVNEWVGVTPLNAKGGYTNIFYHFTDRYFTDYTENGVVFLLD